MSDKPLTIALAVSHAAHRPERVDSMARLRAMLGDWPGPVHIESEKNPHHIWSMRMWRFGASSGADHLLCLQDDSVVPENLHAALHAFLATYPDQICGLFGSHPIARELARSGQRAYRTRAWLLGIGYTLSRSVLAEFLPWAERNEQAMRQCSEDSFINRFAVDTGRDIYHPLPSLVDHDLTLPSTWGADQKGNRRATTTWREFYPTEIARPDFWINPGTPRFLTDNLGPRCWGCLEEPAFVDFAGTGMAIGASCWAKVGERMMAMATAKQQGI